MKGALTTRASCACNPAASAESGKWLNKRKGGKKLHALLLAHSLCHYAAEHAAQECVPGSARQVPCTHCSAHGFTMLSKCSYSCRFMGQPCLPNSSFLRHRGRKLVNRCVRHAKTDALWPRH